MWEMVWSSAVLTIVDATQLMQLYQLDLTDSAPPPRNGTRCLDIPREGADLCVQLSDADCTASEDKAKLCCICGGGMKVECPVPHGPSNKKAERAPTKTKERRLLSPEDRGRRASVAAPPSSCSFQKIPYPDGSVSLLSPRGQFVVAEKGGWVRAGFPGDAGQERLQESVHLDGTTSLRSSHGFLVVRPGGAVVADPQAGWLERTLVELENGDGTVSFMSRDGFYLTARADGLMEARAGLEDAEGRRRFWSRAGSRLAAHVGDWSIQAPSTSLPALALAAGCALLTLGGRRRLLQASSCRLVEPLAVEAAPAH